VKTTFLGLAMVPRIEFRGAGSFAGLAPDPAVQGSPDGRYRKLNVPAVGRITLHERRGMQCIAQTYSAADGTWAFNSLDPAIDYTIIGWDDTGAQNAAIQDWLQPYVSP